MEMKHKRNAYTDLLETERLCCCCCKICAATVHDMVAFARLHIAVLAVLSKNCLVYEILVANSHLYYSG